MNPTLSRTALCLRLASVLRAARLQARLEIKEVARALSVSRNTLANWESGRTGPDLYQIATLAELYGRPLAGLIEEVLGHEPAPPVGRYTIRQGPPASITCHTCNHTSHHPRDVEHRYCCYCHVFHDDAAPP
jgi:DNA-binding XRE family transcriptional regulator